MQVQEELGARLGRDVFLLSITLDPERDGPEELRAYAAAAGARPGWTFLTGDAADITTLRRRLGLFDPDPLIDADMTQHAGRIVIGNEPLARWSSVPAVLGPRRILRQLERVGRSQIAR